MTTKEKVLVYGSVGVALIVAYMVIKKLSKPKMEEDKKIDDKKPSESPTETPKSTSSPTDNLEVKNKYGEDCYPKKYEVISNNAYYYIKDKNKDLVKDKKIPKGTIVILWDIKSDPFFIQEKRVNKEDILKWINRNDVKDLGIYDFTSKKSIYCNCENYVVTTKGKNLNRHLVFIDKNGKKIEKIIDSIPNGTIIEIPKSYREDEYFNKKNYWWLCDLIGSVSKDYIKLVK